MNPKVSVIVPVYNAEKYIKKCIDSILGQTLKELEIIFINDGSKDNSLSIIKEYAKDDNRIIVVDQENNGPSAARNKGIEISTGEYIGFVDSDDFIEEEMYEELYDIASSYKSQIAMCNYNEVYINDGRTYKSNSFLMENKCYNKNEINEKIIRTFTKSENYGFYSLVNKIYEREWLLATNIRLDIERDHGEDWWFNIQLFSQLESFICSSKTLYNYIHINKNSLMGKYRENQFDLCLDGRMKLISLIPEELIDYSELNTRFFYEVHGYLIRTFMELNNYKECKELFYKVINNKEVIKACKDNMLTAISLRIISFFIKKELKNTVFCIYKFYSAIRG